MWRVITSLFRRKGDGSKKPKKNKPSADSDPGPTTEKGDITVAGGATNTVAPDGSTATTTTTTTTTAPPANGSNGEATVATTAVVNNAAADNNDTGMLVELKDGGKVDRKGSKANDRNTKKTPVRSGTTALTAAPTKKDTKKNVETKPSRSTSLRDLTQIKKAKEEQEREKEKPKDLESPHVEKKKKKKSDEKKEVIVVNSPEELPSDIQKKLKQAKISPELISKHFDVLLYVLSFTLKDKELVCPAIPKVESKYRKRDQVPGVFSAPGKAWRKEVKNKHASDQPNDSAPASPKSHRKSENGGSTQENNEDTAPRKESTTASADTQPPSPQVPQQEKATQSQPILLQPQQSLHNLATTASAPDELQTATQTPLKTGSVDSAPLIAPNDTEGPQKQQDGDEAAASPQMLSPSTVTLSASASTTIGASPDTMPAYLAQASESLFAKGNPKEMYSSMEYAGKGGFGRVFVAKNKNKHAPSDPEKVAVKLMPHTTEKEMRMNLNEIAFMKFAKHPNIVEYITSYVLKDEAWLIMEYMEGGTLAEAVRSCRFSEAQVAYTAKAVLKGLEFLHENKLGHRDLKSSNVMLSIQGEVKIIDFGLCEDFTTNEYQLHMCGSPFWMPPEMILQKPHNYMADIWSFAVCMIEMLQQHVPRRKNKLKAMFLAATQGITLKERHGEVYSAEIKDFLGSCLQIDHTKRPTAKELLQHPFIKKAESTKAIQKLLTHIFLCNSLHATGFY